MAAACGSSSGRSAAAQSANADAERAPSSRSSMSAHLCLIAWNEPIGRPNCSRIPAYATAVSRAHAASPTCSAANRTAPVRSACSTAAVPAPTRRAGVARSSTRA